jgi:CubicO group peptidase (beta-lactamase class C family)
VPGTARDYPPTVPWQNAPPEGHGLDPVVLATTNEFAANTKPPVSGYIVVRHGYVVFEEYYRGFSASSYHSVNSVTKSIISALIGIALRDGLLSSVDQRLTDLFPQHAWAM